MRLAGLRCCIRSIGVVLLGMCGGIALPNSAPAAPLADAVDWRPGAAFQGFRAGDLSAAANGDSGEWRKRLQLDRWFPQPQITVCGVPLALLARRPDLATTAVREKSDLRLPAGVHAAEVYLLLAADLVGEQEPAYGTGHFQAIRDVDRFCLRLEYADGSADECLPLNPATGKFGVVAGLQMVAAAADPEKRLEAVVLRDRSRQAAFAVAAVTFRTAGDRLFPAALEDSPPLKPARAAGRANPWDYLKGPTPPVELRVDGKAIAPARLEPVSNRPDEPTRGSSEWKVRGVAGLRVGLEAKQGEGTCIVLTAWVHNGTGEAHTIDLTAPRIGPYRLGDNAADAFYLWPQRPAIFDNRECSCRNRYCGDFPLQFMDTFDLRAGRGLALQTLDTGCLRKEYLLEKRGGALRIGVTYPRLVLKPGERFQTPPAELRVTDGDWHRGLEAYRRWLAGWYKPQSPRKPWFREVFNFRQRSVWGDDPLYDAQRGEFHLERAIDEARREFGGIDYLHLFDWGSLPDKGRLYGRTGDYPPYTAFRGGGAALRQAIARVQKQGVHVGLYIEGYLLEERGKLGQASGRRWQIIGADGRGTYYPNSHELYACPALPEWQEVQASTYAARLAELQVDGMYLDQFGFAGVLRDCWAKDHGHAVPSYAVTAERDCTRAVRQRIAEVRPGVALYTEGTPVDVATQEQDGSFTYAMFHAQRMPLRVPLNLSRFAIPDFKTFEILSCGKPVGSWATGVKWTFFNGEGLWLRHPAATAFEPETRAAIRRCYAILHKHRDAFTTLCPIPLAPTEIGGVYANAFPAGGKTVYTLYNARHRTVRGEVLRVGGDVTACYDEWNGRPARTRRDGAETAIHLELGPLDVGCVVVSYREAHRAGS